MVKGAIGYAAICPGRNIHVFNLRISNEPSSLYQVLGIFKRHGLNIVNFSSLMYRHLPEDLIDVSLFIDFTDSSATVEEVLEELRAQDNVVEAEVVRQQLPGITVNTAAFPLELLGYIEL